MFYLDNAATTQPLDAVISVVQKTMTDFFGNPSSLHGLGVAASERLGLARRELAAFLGLSPEWVIFTSGATEANQTVLLGGIRNPNKKRNHILMSVFEHPSIRMSIPVLQGRGYEVEILMPNALGMIDPKDVALRVRPETELVSIIGIHNEIGVVQDIAAIQQAIKTVNPKTLFHVDGVQWLGKRALPSPEQMPDFFTFSAHKFHGPRGVGGILKRPDVPMKALIQGGGHERGFRSGTENVPGIAGAVAAFKELDIPAWHERALAWQKMIYGCVVSMSYLQWIGPEPGVDRTPYISTFSYVGCKSEVFIHELEEEGIYISSGSACSEKVSKKTSYWRSLGLSEDVMSGILRVSVGRLNRDEDIQKMCSILMDNHP